jgi:hypothetical protein
MEGVLYSESPWNETVDAIELLLYLDCRNIWVWISSDALYESLMTEEWEPQVHLNYSSKVNSIGDCLRELYLRDDSRDNLLIIGDLDHLPEKISLHKNGFGKNIGTILFADGNVGYEFKKGKLLNYDWIDLKQKGRALDIAYCNRFILNAFYDNFDCHTFHDLLLSDPIRNSFGVKMDKRIKFFDNPPSSEPDSELDFITELKGMLNVDLEHAKLELSGLRLSYQLSHSELIDALKELNARQELLDIIEN